MRSSVPFDAMTEQRFFYHSFPRPRKSQDPHTKGAAILESACRNGLLLVPELVSFHDPSGSRQGDKVHALQRRMCFTELAPLELGDHAKVFGPFGFEYDIGTLRSWGVLPVIYVPDWGEGRKVREATGVSLIARLADATQILQTLAGALRLDGATLVVDLRRREGGTVTREFDPHETAAIREYIRFLEGATGQRMEEVVGAVSSISSLFYPTENLTYTGELGYYRQREWRLFSGQFVAGQPMTELTNLGQQKELLKIDRTFFGRKLKFPDGEATLAEKSHYLARVDGIHPLAMARRIIVPEVFESQAAKMLSAFGLHVPIVTSESLGVMGAA